MPKGRKLGAIPPDTSVSRALVNQADMLLTEIDEYVKDRNPWMDKADAFDFLNTYHDQMYQLLKQVVGTSK